MTNKRDTKGKLKRQMVKYLGSESSQAYKNMVEAIARRNQIQELQRRLKQLREQEQGGSKIQHQNRRLLSINAPLTLNEKKLLHSLQQQLREMTKRLERLETQFFLK